MGGGWSGSRCSKGDGKGCIEFAGEEGEGSRVDEATSSMDKGPPNDGVDGDVFPQRNANINGAAISEEVREVVGDHGSKETGPDGVGNFGGVRVGNGPSEADWVKGLMRVIEFNEAEDTGGILSSKGFVEGVQPTVEACTSVKQGGEGRWVGWKGGQAKRKSEGGKDMGDGNRDGPMLRVGNGVEGVGEGHKLAGLFGGWLLRGDRVGELGVRGGVPRRRWVDDAVVGVLDYRTAVVVRLAQVGLMRKEFSEEEGFGGFVVAQGTWCAFSIGKSRMGLATSEATFEGTGVDAAVLAVGVRVNWVVVVGVGRGLVLLENRFRRADEGMARRRGRLGRRRLWGQRFVVWVTGG